MPVVSVIGAFSYRTLISYSCANTFGLIRASLDNSMHYLMFNTNLEIAAYTTSGAHRAETTEKQDVSR